jgi:uncharacterized membrane protein
MEDFSLIIAVIALLVAFFANRNVNKLTTEIKRLKMEVGVFMQRYGAAEVGIKAPIAPVPDAPNEAPKTNWSKLETAAPAEKISTEAAPQSPKPAKPTRDMEGALASRWFVWIGGAAIAIGGLLFVKYAYDVGLISPAFQIFLGLVAAAVLIYLGHRAQLSRKPDQAPDYVPAALSAAGLVTAFGSVYASYALYNLVSPATAFVGLAVVAIGAFYLARFQGPLIAALGLIGAMVTPLLIPSDNPNAWGFFAYLLVVSAAAFFTSRAHQWWWLSFAALAGTTAWSMLWLVDGPFEIADIIPIGLFALAQGAFSAILPTGRSIFLSSSGSLLQPQSMSKPLQIAVVGMAAESGILATLVHVASHHTLALCFFAIGIAAITYFGWLKKGWSLAPLLAAAFAWAVLMAWPNIAFHEIAMDERGVWTTVAGQLAPYAFRNWMTFGLLGFTGIGFYGLRQKTPPQIWALLAAGSAFLFLFGQWARVEFIFSTTIWALAALVLAAVLLTAIWLHRSKLVSTEQNEAYGYLLAGVSLLGVFAADRLFDGIWFTLAVAVLATLVAFSARLVPINMSGKIASLLATFVAIRLFLAREFWGIESGLPLGDHWPLYGYGIPIVLFWFSSRYLRQTNHARSAMAFEGISLGLLISLISLEIRVLIAGNVTEDAPQLLETSTQILSWLGAAYGLAYRQNMFSSFISLWGSRVLLVASCAGMIGLSLFAMNPLFVDEPVIGNSVFNSLLLAYLAPVPLLALIARKLEGLGWGKWRNALGILALVLLFAYVTLETRRIFQGPLLSSGNVTEGEFYAYSAAWLGLAVALFLGGVKLARQNIRLGGMAVMVLVVLKVFLLDLGDLGGLLRIFSFVGLGLCLVGMGWVYTKYVAQPKETVPPLPTP